MLDIASSHSTGGRPSPSSSNVGGKRIPASLMKMRRESLAASGKYTLPKIDASTLPETSLISLSTATKMKTVSAHGTTTSGALPAFCTPKRQTPKSLRAALDLATSHFESKPDLDDILQEATAVRRPSAELGSDHSRNKSLRRSQSVDIDNPVSNGGGLTSKDMDALLKSGLATPRRARRSIRIPAVAASTSSGGGGGGANVGGGAADTTTAQSKRFSKLKSKTTVTATTGTNPSSSSCNDSLGESGSSHSKNSHHNSPRTRRMSRRTKSVDETIRTPRRARGKPTIPGVRRSNTMQPSIKTSSSSSSSKKQHLGEVVVRENNSDEETAGSSFTDISEDATPVPVAPAVPVVWKCTCGEDNDMVCKFCGMCGTPQRWECADCSYLNKCKFRFCGMCGIPKKVKNSKE